MRFKKMIFIALSIILISATSIVSFADKKNDSSQDIKVTWQDDLDLSVKAKLTIQQYDVSGLYFASQGSGTSRENRIRNERMWEDESIIFDDERIISDTYYVDAVTKKKTVGVDKNVLFYKDSGYFSDESKQSLKAWGYYVPSKSGYYKFKMVSDDGSYLSIFSTSTSLNDLQGKEDILINDMSVSSYNSNVSRSIYLEAKKPYPILIKYFNWGGDGLFTFNSSYSNDGRWRSNSNFAPVNQNDLYPSKKTDFLKIHGDTQYLENMQVSANDRLRLLEGQSSLEINRVRELLKQSQKMVLEYYNYSQDEMNKLYEEMRVAILQLEDPVVALKTPYPDDLLKDEKGKIKVQKYRASDLNAANEGSRSNNVATWTNESFIFDSDRKDGPSRLYTAEIEKSQKNAAVEEIFFYDGGGNYGYDAKEIREGWGYFVPNKTGYYQFESLFDDGIRAYLYTNKELNDLKYTVGESTELASHYAIGVFNRHSSKIRLEAGKAYPIYINHFNWHGPNKLALRYRFSISSNVTGSYIDVPASWFYGSDKDDFFEIHGNIAPVISKKTMLEDALSKLPSNTSSEDKAKFNVLIDKAKTMISKYYNYSDEEIKNFITEVNNLLKDNNYNIKIKRYIEDKREYIEITEPFSDGKIDEDILTVVKRDNGVAKPSVNNGVLSFKGNTMFSITEKFSDYDYIEVDIDQLEAVPNQWYPYAGIGVSAKSSNYLYNEIEYLKKRNNGKNENMKIDFGEIKKFDANRNTNFSTKLIAKKNENGKFDVTLKLYPMGQVTEDKLLVSITSSNSSYDFKNLYLASYDYYWYDYKLDNLKILAYKSLESLDVEIENFQAETSGNFIKLTWDDPDETFDSYVINEIIDGVIIEEHEVSNPNAEEFFVSLVDTTDYSDRTFEIYAKKDTRYSTKTTTTWQGGVSFLSITNFKASTNGSEILLNWDGLDSKLIDKYVIKETTIGNESTLSLNVDKAARTFTLPLNTSLVKRTFTIEAFRGTEKNKAATAIWENDLSELTINDFKVVKNGSDLVLTWNKVVGDFDEFEITEVFSGSPVIIDPHNAGKNDITKSIAIGSLVGDRTFTIVAKKGVLKSSPATVTWNDEFADFSITGFKAKSNGDKIVLTWNKVASDIDNFVVTQVGIVPSKTLNKTDLTTEFELGDSLNARNFTIHAVLNGRSSTNVQTTWSVSQNSMTVNQISGHTGKKLGVLVFEGNVSITPVSEDISLEGYKIEGTNLKEIAFTIGTSAKTLNVMYVKSSDSTVDETNFKAEALESINKYASTRKIDFFEDSYYAITYKTDDEDVDAVNTKKALLEDLKRILETAGLTDVRDKNLEEYKDNILAGNPYTNLADLQAVIEEINGPIDTTNKDHKEDKYIDLVNNTKLTAHDFEFGLATEVNITKDPIYNPTFEFKLQGNEYLTYKNPTVYLYDENNKRVSSKAIIEYDAVNFKYDIKIIPTALVGNMLIKGKYYVNLDTKTEVNTEKHTLASIIANNTDEKSKASIKKAWEFSYFIDEIEINHTKISEGLYSTMTINYTTSETSTVVETIESERINFELENTKALPGGF